MRPLLLEAAAIVRALRALGQDALDRGEDPACDPAASAELLGRVEADMLEREGPSLHAIRSTLNARLKAVAVLAAHRIAASPGGAAFQLLAACERAAYLPGRLRPSPRDPGEAEVETTAEDVIRYALAAVPALARDSDGPALQAVAEHWLGRDSVTAVADRIIFSTGAQ